MNDITLSTRQGHLLAVSFQPAAYPMITRLFWLGTVANKLFEIGSTRYGLSLIENNSFVRIVDLKGRLIFAFHPSLCQQVFDSTIFSNKSYFIKL